LQKGGAFGTLFFVNILLLIAKIIWKKEFHPLLEDRKEMEKGTKYE